MTIATLAQILAETSIAAGSALIPAMSLDFTTAILDSRVTASGGVGGTRINAQGLIVPASAPRFNYDRATGRCRGVLIEEARQNLVLQSGNCSASPWFSYLQGAATTAAATANAGISPDGANNSTLIQLNCVGNTTNDRAIWTQTVTLTAGNYWRRVWIKARNSADVGKVILHQTEAASGQTSTTVTLTADWQEITSPLTSTGTNHPFSFECRGGTASSLSASFEIWAAEIQPGNFLTSHIPSGASAGSRTIDYLRMEGVNVTSWLNPLEGTFHARGDFPQSNNAEVFCLDDAGSPAGNALEIYRASATRMNGFVYAGTTQADMQGPATSAGVRDYLLAYQLNNMAFGMDGFAPTVDTSANVPTSLTRLIIGAYRGPNTPVNGNIERIDYFSHRVSNAQMQRRSGRRASLSGQLATLTGGGSAQVGKRFAPPNGRTLTI